MSKTLNYQAIIEKHFKIRPQEGGEAVPFRLNDVQREYLETLYNDYPTMQGVRENVLKARREGFSSLIEAILVVDFIYEKGIAGQIISHKESEVKPHMDRINLYLTSWMESVKVPGKDDVERRKAFLKEDQPSKYLRSHNDCELFVGTAGAKTIGRGGTLQNLHWTEVAFYPNTSVLNAESLVPPAEEQVKEGVGKIFRETTGNMLGDFFSSEWDRAVKGESNFAARFFPWFEAPENRLTDAQGYTPTEDEAAMMRKFELDPEQMAWYHKKSKGYKTRAKFLREYPSEAREAFLASGTGYFDADVLKKYFDNTRPPRWKGQLAMDGNPL